MSEDGFCPRCLRSLWSGGGCKRRDCPGYVDLWLRDTAECIGAGLACWNHKTCLITFTPPGKDQLPWDTTWCSRVGAHKHAASLGCRVQPLAAAQWNLNAERELKAVLNAAGAAVRRKFGTRARIVVLERVFEPQQRGVLHPHVVLGYRGAVDREALDVYRHTCRRVAKTHGFGRGAHGFDGGMPDRFSAADAARYISKYLRKPGHGGALLSIFRGLEMVNPRLASTGRRKHVLRVAWVSPTLSKESGVTMAFLRFKRWVFMAWGRQVTEAMSGAEWRRLWWFRQTFGIVLLRHGRFGEPRPPPATDRTALNELFDAARRSEERLTARRAQLVLPFWL